MSRAQSSRTYIQVSSHSVKCSLLYSTRESRGRSSAHTWKSRVYSFPNIRSWLCAHFENVGSWAHMKGLHQSGRVLCKFPIASVPRTQALTIQQTQQKFMRRPSLKQTQYQNTGWPHEVHLTSNRSRRATDSKYRFRHTALGGWTHGENMHNS